MHETPAQSHSTRPRTAYLEQPSRDANGFHSGLPALPCPSRRLPFIRRTERAERAAARRRARIPCARYHFRRWTEISTPRFPTSAPDRSHHHDFYFRGSPHHGPALVRSARPIWQRHAQPFALLTDSQIVPALETASASTRGLRSSAIFF